MRREHVDFGESTEEIAPLTAEEKKQRLDELRANLAEKRARQAVLDKEEHKKNEVRQFPFYVLKQDIYPIQHAASRKVY